ncbi:FadR/GntR family transcriptional regulator [Aureimonas sp. AU20]|uniref:FadR/GntR family transcriptional regulator n=1 Tax=Aureimonas sp. AU20 TaxID=1349819 RepID=UPI000781173E
MSDQFQWFDGSVLDGVSPLPAMDRLRDTLDALGRHVERAGLRAGDRLPAEREMMQALAVGRSTIREAVRQLQALGVVETRKGSGSYLLRPLSAATVHMPLSITATGLREGLLQTLDIRRGLEAEASALAALRHTSEDLARMEVRLIEMERVHRLNGTAGPEDLLFHLSVYEAAHNPLFSQLLEQMREAFERFFLKPFDRPDFAGRSFPFHREMFEAIAARDPGLAREKTLAILDIVEEDIKDMSQ